MGYRTNPLVAAHLAYVRTRRAVETGTVIAFLVPHASRNSWTSGARRVLRGATARACSLGYSVEAFSYVEPDLGPERLESILRARSIHAVLLPPLFRTDPPLRLRWEMFAVAAVGQAVDDLPMHLARNHHTGTLTLAWRRLRTVGYRRIGLHLSQVVDERMQHRWPAMFLFHQNELPVESRVPMLLQSVVEKTEFIEWCREHGPDVILTKHNETRKWLEEAGWKIPQRVGLAHLDWIPEFGNCAGVNQHMEQSAAAAVDLLVEQLQRNERGLPKHPKVVLTGGSWQNGVTVKQRSKSARSRCRVL
jgi:DNA-binding LacI/PurR family transcriptional regulator